jgi:hypothetical protein
MISVTNKPINKINIHDNDFTEKNYRKLLKIATKNWVIADYSNIPWGHRFILWRHDLDFSLNRSLALAKIEQQEGLKATYFLNPHSEFYNLAELSQFLIIKEIVSLGHDLGLHYDATFHTVTSKTDLNCLVNKEAAFIEELFNVKPTAFSFHNPQTEHLQFEADNYGGLVNCYSKRFKSQVSYCSDSNGYWRFNRLQDVLAEAKESCLQVLTHPGWWQEKPMPPRQRVFRAAVGRAEAILKVYDRYLEQHDRINHVGQSPRLDFLRAALPHQFDLCDYLWNKEAYQTLFVELWRLHEAQINRLCKAYLRKEWQVPANEVNAFFGDSGLRIDGWRLFEGLFKLSWRLAVNTDKSNYGHWLNVRNQLVHGRSSSPTDLLKEGCIFISQIILALAEYGKKQPFKYDGLAHLGSIGLPTIKNADGSLSELLDERKKDIKDFPKKRWEELKLMHLFQENNND